MLRYWSIVMWALLAGWGCAIDTVPMPEGESEETRDADDTDYIHGAGGAAASPFKASALFYASDDPVFLVGTTGATAEIGEITVENLDSDDDPQYTHAATDGSFNLWVHAQIGDSLRLTVTVDGGALPSLLLELRPPSVAAHMANDKVATTRDDDPADTIEGITVTTQAEQSVEITGEPGFFVPGITVVIANSNNGRGVTAPVQSDGGFTALIRGESGDGLQLFATEPASSNAGDQVFELVVP